MVARLCPGRPLLLATLSVLTSPGLHGATGDRVVKKDERTGSQEAWISPQLPTAYYILQIGEPDEIQGPQRLKWNDNDEDDGGNQHWRSFHQFSGFSGRILYLIMRHEAIYLI